MVNQVINISNLYWFILDLIEKNGCFFFCGTYITGNGGHTTMLPKVELHANTISLWQFNGSLTRKV